MTELLAWLAVVLALALFGIWAYPPTRPVAQAALRYVAVPALALAAFLATAHIGRRRTPMPPKNPVTPPMPAPTEAEVRAIRRDGRKRAAKVRAELGETEDLAALEARAEEELRRAGLLP